MSSPVPTDSEKQSDRYQRLCKQMEALLEGETDWVANLANAAALLNQTLADINWVGFYRLKNGELLVGPFQGGTACVHIAVGRGVCGTAVQQDRTQIIPEVRRFPGHIACDSRSASELVIPLHSAGKVAGVLDIDSPTVGRFSEEDARWLEKIAELISHKCAWEI